MVIVILSDKELKDGFAHMVLADGRLESAPISVVRKDNPEKTGIAIRNAEWQGRDPKEMNLTPGEAYQLTQVLFSLNTLFPEGRPGLPVSTPEAPKEADVENPLRGK